MRFKINFTNDSFEKAWDELEMLGPQLMGDMTIASGRTVESKRFIVVVLEEIEDTVALMRTLRNMAENGIGWKMTATSRE